jgi:P4 family phage/plasmid primase-like protien
MKKPESSDPLKSSNSLDALNAELVAVGINPIKDVDMCPERTRYVEHLAIPFQERKDNWSKDLKHLQTQYELNFHAYFASVYPFLLYEIGEDKVYWNYNDETGVYDELNFSTVRGFVIKLLTKEGLAGKATEAFTKTVLVRYRGLFIDRGKNYEDFDIYNDWFHASNGWVNIKTLAFEDHTPDRLSRRVSAVTYDIKATCPTYDKFLDEQIKLAPDQVRVIDQFSGLLLTPDITKQKMLVLIGKPGCGKSTLLDLWQDVLGDLATQNSLHEIASDSFRFRGSTLVGKNLCWFDEVEVTRSNMGNSLINLITGQQIKVERKGINGIAEVQNQLKCVLTANTLPRSAEMGIYRRMILIYLTYSFYDNMTDNKNIRALLKAESSGVLNRMLKGYKDIEKNNGFTLIDGHDDLIEEYKASSNTVAEFLDEYFVFDYEAPKISTKVLLEAYKSYADDRYVNTLTPARFGVLLSSHGLMKFNQIATTRLAGGERAWSGLRLREYYEFNNSGFIREKEVF